MPRDDDIFSDALEMTEPERAAFLKRACAGDAARRARIEALFRGHAGAPAYFHASPAADPPAEQPGNAIGRYQLIEKIGEGGCGVVWRAEQTEPVRRRVALKVIKLGMDTREVIARFEAERQTLALMDHPNIAKIHDAGATETGRPFFVMELVHGVPITRYCDEHMLSTTARLTLFIDVCHAIQHAHQKGIIHRDIKPSNILISEVERVDPNALSGTPKPAAWGQAAPPSSQPHPKVIDFGIAKATQDRLPDATVFTALQQFIGTPAYMSPEQADFGGGDIDTRSDIYSLGVLLYELLTGQPPFDAKSLASAGLDEMRRIIREVEPARPSTLAQTAGAALRRDSAESVIHRGVKPLLPRASIAELSGDLDWIVMKAIEKNRTRRYASASGLAADVQRHLAHEPILARPPNAAYTLQKLVRRHRFAFGAAGAIGAVLLVGAAVSTWQAIRATRAEQEQRWLRSRAEVQALALRHQAYASDLNLAQQSLASGNLGRAHELLNRHRPAPGEIDMRGWEWRHLWQRSRGQELFSFRPNSDPGVSCVVFSPDGTTFATGGPGQPVQVWTATSRQLIAALPGSAAGMQNPLCFSPDGALLAFSESECVVIVETATWQVKVRLPTEARDRVFSRPVFFSRDGQTLAAWSGGGVQFWDTGTWAPGAKVEREEMPHGIFCLSDDWKFLAVGGQKQTEIWDRVALTKVDELPGWTVGLKFSPGGSLLATGDYEGNVRLWDAAARKEVASWKAHRSAVRGFSFAADGKTLVSCGEDHAIHIWDVASPRRLSTLLGHQNRIWGISLSPDDRMLASASSDGTVKLWSLDSAAEKRDLPQAVAPLWFSPDSRTIATINQNAAIQFWDVPTRRVLRTVAPVADSIDESLRAHLAQDGRTLVLGSVKRGLELWDLERRERMASRTPEPNEKIEEVLFSPDQRWIASVHSHRRTVHGFETRLWNVATHQVTARFPSASGVVAFSPDSRMVATLATPRTVQLWDTTTHREIRTLACVGGQRSLAFSPDGRWLASGEGQFVTRVWEVASGHELAVLGGHVGGIFDLAFSPDGKTLATGSTDDTVKFWSTATWQEVMTLPNYGKNVGRLLFSPDGMMLAVGNGFFADDRGPVQLWHAPSLVGIDVAEK